MRALSLVLVITGAVACGATPSRKPLSPPRETASHRKDSSRVTSIDESSSSEEQGAEIEIQVDEGGDGDSARVSSSTTSPKTCAFHAASASQCSRLGSTSLGACAGSIAERACETWGPHLDARVTDKWLTCLSDPRASGARCSGTETLRCAVAAVGIACVDGAYKTRCQHIAEACSDTLPELTASLCEHAIAAFSPAKRGQIVECLEHGCDTGAFGACIP